MAKQGIERPAGIQVATTAFHILKRDQHLCHGQAIATKRLLPDL